MISNSTTVTLQLQLFHMKPRFHFTLICLTSLALLSFIVCMFLAGITVVCITYCAHVMSGKRLMLKPFS